MTTLRRRMMEDMQVRSLSPQTQATYVQQVSLFARHFNRSPELLGPEEGTQQQGIDEVAGRVFALQSATPLISMRARGDGLPAVVHLSLELRCFVKLPRIVQIPYIWSPSHHLSHYLTEERLFAKLQGK